VSQATCVDEASYSEALTRGKKYEVLSEKAGAIRVKGDNGRSRWFPKSCFDLSGKTIPVLESFTIDDPIQNPKCDYVEVSVRMSTRRCRWCIFVTSAWIAAYFGRALEPKAVDHDGFVIDQIMYMGETLTTKSGVRFEEIHAPHIIIVAELSSEVIEATLRYIDSQGELKASTRPQRCHAAR
jgi:hypothetical protein